MGYVGNTPALNYTTFAVQHFTTSATTGYTLDNAVTNENGIALFINNVRQEPGASYAYTASGTTLTLSAATTTSDTMYCVFIGKAVQTVNPGAGSVGTSQLATDAVTQAKMADDSVGTAEILDTNVTGAKLNDDAISGQGALGAAPADTDEFLVSDAGVLKRVDYSYIKGITQTSFLPTAAPLIINGDFEVAQRATSVTGDTSVSYSTVDRFKTICEVGTFTIAQESLSDADYNTTGFRKALRLDCTATESPGAGDQTTIEYRFEGYDVQMFKKGTAGAQTYTLAFWVRANKTASDVQVNLKDNDNTRICGGTYDIDATDTWEHKIINYAADTTGVIDNDNGAGFTIEWWLDGGSNYSGGAVPTAWETTANADRNVTNFDIGGNTANDWAIAGVQLEMGTYTSATLPPFRHESFADNWRRCSRYYTKWLSDTPSGGTGGDPAYTCGGQASGTASIVNMFVPLGVPLRAAPSINDPNGIYLDYDTGTAVTSGTWTVRANQPYTMSCIIMGIDGCANLVDNTLASARPYGGDLTFNAEL